MTSNNDEKDEERLIQKLIELRVLLEHPGRREGHYDTVLTQEFLDYHWSIVERVATDRELQKQFESAMSENESIDVTSKRITSYAFRKYLYPKGGIGDLTTEGLRALDKMEKIVLPHIRFDIPEGIKRMKEGSSDL